MTSLFINRDCHIMMLEVGVEKLFVPNTSPFDDVITSKFIVSFRFFDNEWIDILPKRNDYKEYQGSIGEEQYFHGGKSVVFSVDQSELDQDCNGFTLDVRARREISRYFEDAEGHVKSIGCAPVCIEDLINSIIEELKLRETLKDYLKLLHPNEPISASMKGNYTLDCKTGSHIDLYVRLTYLSECVIGEIDKPYNGPIKYFYAQEHKNLSMPYECWEVEPPGKPRYDLPFPKPLVADRVHCCCTPDQLNNLLGGDQQQEVQHTEVDQNNGKRKRKKKKKKADHDDGYVPPKPEKGTGLITVGIVDKVKPCEPILPKCELCCPTEICEIACNNVPCIPVMPCLPTICCDN